MCDLLWSDPEDVKGWGMSPRGAGFLFGGDVAAQFMESNSLIHIARAHQLVMEGYVARTCLPPTNLKYQIHFKEVQTRMIPQGNFASRPALLNARSFASYSNFLVGVVFFSRFRYKAHFDGGSVLTVWSAPNYCYRCGNVAAIMQVEGHLEQTFSIFRAAPNELRGPTPKSTPEYFL